MSAKAGNAFAGVNALGALRKDHAADGGSGSSSEPLDE